ncbi:predicted protein [Nematostella vectensis]|uniref:Gamma-butyrobetaine dioxygenase n=1 Tax=Nematostella vectensis TaxID=45351 RepID=A7S7D2_NEMVE|nr:gamma-butyrobetaine dioxygenase [Nematostella vectensis]EDO40404.1 predicted protein [Nematostella vectensis]|eukprot:XP_001632467.1 predicted protein [Nematostella vectensis]
MMLCRLRSTLCRPSYVNQLRVLGVVRSKSSVVASAALVKHIELEDNDGMLHVHWKNNQINRYPYVYLRDNCQCPKCYNSLLLQRNLDSISEVDLDVKPKAVEVRDDGKQIHITWPNEHISQFNSAWLHNKKLPESDDLTGKMKLNKKGVEFWNKSMLQGKLVRFNYEDVMTKKSALFEWLHTLHSVGIALIEEAPSGMKPIAVERLATRVGYIKDTHYGHTFDVNAKFDANNLAYTTADLPLHCDIPQSEYYPGVQMLHCLQQAPTEGGESIFVDGFFIAQEIKEQHPRLFNLLATTPIPYVDIGKDEFGDFHLKNKRESIELDELGHIVRFTYNNHVRDYFMDSPVEKVQLLYQAYLILGQMMRDPVNMLEYKLSPGEVVSFNNSRVLHGRRGYTITGEGNRHLQGCYMDWDLVNARLRNLATVLGKTFED